MTPDEANGWGKAGALFLENAFLSLKLSALGSACAELAGTAPTRREIEESYKAALLRIVDEECAKLADEKPAMASRLKEYFASADVSFPWPK